MSLDSHMNTFTFGVRRYFRLQNYMGRRVTKILRAFLDWNQ